MNKKYEKHVILKINFRYILNKNWIAQKSSIALIQEAQVPKPFTQTCDKTLPHFNKPLKQPNHLPQK